MNTQNNNASFDIVETISHEFNGHYFYGLEFVLDEIIEETKKQSQKKSVEKVDWFGLWDPTI